MNKSSHLITYMLLGIFCGLLGFKWPAALCYAGDEYTVAFQTDFEKEAVDKEASQLEFMVLGEGDFRVKQDGTNKVLELAPIPMDTHGLLFGPTEKENITVQARIFGTSTGRRFPVFGIGVNGLGGYILRVNPAKKALELLKGDDVKQSIPYTWLTGTWTVFSLMITKVKDGVWSIQGKAWEQGKEDPKEPVWNTIGGLQLDESEQPPAGRPSLWGVPYSAQPIRFDDLVVKKLKK